MDPRRATRGKKWRSVMIQHDAECLASQPLEKGPQQ